jgi:2'-phosphotransferase
MTTPLHSSSSRKGSQEEMARKSSSSKNDKPPPKKKKNLRTLSHSLSWALRHAAPELGLSMTADGYVPVDEILTCRHKKLRGGWTVEDIHAVVETNDKQRFSLQEKPAADYGRDEKGTVLCVRANQGHSIQTVDSTLLLARLEPTELEQLPCVVHGTYSAAWGSISKQGLKRLTRNHIHFAPGLPDHGSVISGMRRTCDIYIYVDVKKCARDGVVFYRSDNNVLLTAGLHEEGTLPVDYFSHVTDASGSILMDQRSHHSSSR